MTKTAYQITQHSQVKFGTSGVRGPVNELNKEVCQAFTQAFLEQLCPSAKHLAMAMDLRPSSPTIANWISEQVLKMGYNIMACGTLPTPALAYYAMQQGIPAIMITGSHIPFDRNGIKFYLPSGEISKAHEHCILNAPLTDIIAGQETGRTFSREAEALNAYRERYTRAFSSLSLTGQRIGVYQHSSVARDLISQTLQSFGAEIITLGRTDRFVALDTEAVSELDQAQASEWSRTYQLDAIVSTDGDGDRPLIADEIGQWLRGDQVGILTCLALQATHISTPINSNTGLESLLPKATIVRTKIGSPFVIEAMRQASEESINVGFEANGGFLLGSNTAKLTALPTRDALLPILSVLQLASANNSPISHLTNQLPQRYSASDRLPNIPFKISLKAIDLLQQNISLRHQLITDLWPKQAIREMSCNTLDGVRIYLSNQTIIHLRVSGNADELRVYIESGSAVDANNVCQRLIKLLSKSPLLPA